jgi:hypothetical protein
MLSPVPPPTYSGYLAPHVDLIRDAHSRGLGTREIAKLLYAAGARADTSDPSVHELTRAHHIANLQMMALYALQRLGLCAARKPRGGLQLTAKRGRDGAWSVPSTAIHPEKNSAATQQELTAERGVKACPLDTIQPPGASPR